VCGGGVVRRLPGDEAGGDPSLRLFRGFRLVFETAGYLDPPGLVTADQDEPEEGIGHEGGERRLRGRILESL
jgi:hypothetical protein